MTEGAKDASEYGICQVYFDGLESSENNHSIINVGALIKYANYVHIVTSKKIRIEHHSKC